jgi:hypothetical protein
MNAHTPFPSKRSGLMAVAATALAMVAMSALAAPSAVTQARAECAMQKQRVLDLQARSSDLDNDPQLMRERRKWENACARAQRLMEQAGLDRPSTPPGRPES